MKKLVLLAIAAAGFAAPAQAEYWDVIAFKLNEGCSFQTHQQITADFNRWGAAYGYEAKILMPLYSDDLETMYWVGSSANAAEFGTAWDAWRNAQADSDSEPAKLWARFVECSTNVRRAGYDVY